MTLRQIIIGTAKLSQMEESELTKVSQFLIKHPGLQRIQLDTAYVYQNSEKLISKFFANSEKEVFVDTKIGLFLNPLISSSTLKYQFYECQRRLHPLKIRNLFLHSVNPHALTDQAYDFLRELKEGGLVSRVGYSGDGKYLERAIRLEFFDLFLSTFSIIDQSNYSLLKDLGDSVSLKRVIGSGVLRNRNYKLLRRRLGAALGETWAKNTHTYQYRYDVISKAVGFQPSLNNFLDYADWKFPKATKIVGVSSLLQLRNLLGIFQKDSGQYRHPEIFDSVWSSLKHNGWQAMT